ncbi:MAG: PTS sugar transporter subunit IIA [Bacteroidetes bacterium]|nr:MAG: PTS sugar transporter subunit IIA [Bacteroidota bacterium]
MKLEEIIAVDSIETNIEVQDKNELLSKMVDLAYKSGKVINKNEALKDIHEREKLMSTGIGKGIALPHAKTNSVEDTVGSFVILKKPVDFESLDGEPVSIVFLLLGRESNVGLHLRILSKISRILNNDEYKITIGGLKSGQEVIDFFKKLEEEE